MAHDLVTEFQELLNNGLFVEDTHTFVKIWVAAVVCDTSACSDLKRTIGHNGTKGCDKCLVVACRLDYRMSYPGGEFQLRTDASLRARADDGRGESSFDDLPLDVIASFPLEPMHLINLGVAKKLTPLWQNLAKVLSAISDGLLGCRECKPMDFQRKCRSLTKASLWKATVSFSALLKTSYSERSSASSALSNFL
ncbi:unnamed protein product [Heterobilharzia americana]|nr:unnamed protein product [Heterobilharzia americana]